LSRKHGIMKHAVEIIPSVYQLTIRGVNIILITEEELTLIDTGFYGSSPKIISFIQSLGRSSEEISLIILTHNHLDHIGGLAELKQLTPAKVAAHKADISYTEGQSPHPGAKRKLLPIPPLSTLRSFFSIKPDEVDIQLEGGEVLKPLGGLKVIHTPGHTLGSISLFFPQKKLLMVGDAINNRYKNLRLPPKMVSANLRQAAESVRGLARLDFDILCFGHGRPLTTDAGTKVQELIEKTKD
jgi:glyoxylase-like metal-dependent hydrolase (beta-lactamase superfamily II)